MRGMGMCWCGVHLPHGVWSAGEFNWTGKSADCNQKNVENSAAHLEMVMAIRAAPPCGKKKARPFPIGTVPPDTY